MTVIDSYIHIDEKSGRWKFYSIYGSSSVSKVAEGKRYRYAYTGYNRGRYTVLRFDDRKFAYIYTNLKGDKVDIDDESRSVYPSYTDEKYIYYQDVVSDYGVKIYDVYTPPIELSIEEFLNTITDVVRRIYREKVCIYDIETPSLQSKEITAIGYKITGEENDETQIVYSVDDFFRELRRKNIYTMVGYNTLEFDIPVLEANGVKIVERNGYLKNSLVRFGDRIYSQIDLYSILNKNRAVYGISEGTPLDLSTVAQYIDPVYTKKAFEKLRYRSKGVEKLSRDELSIYLEGDIELTEAVYRAVYPTHSLVSILLGYPQRYIQRMRYSTALSMTLAWLYRRRGILVESRYRSYEYSDSDYGVEPIKKMIKSERVSAIESGIYKGVICEYDYDQLYPTDLVYNLRDVASTVVSEVIYTSKPVGIHVKPIYTPRPSYSVLRDSRTGDIYALKHTYGYGLYTHIETKLYFLRRYTKQMKKESSIYKSLDQAVKILANSFFGIVSLKGEGYILNEAVSSSTFLGGLNAKAVLEEIASTYGEILYGDTDSVYILLKDGYDPHEVEKMIDMEVKKRLGELYSVKLEDIYTHMFVPKSKTSNISKKNYILAKNGEVVKIRGGVVRKEIPNSLKPLAKHILTKLLIEKIPPDRLAEEIVNSIYTEQMVETKTVELTRSKNYSRVHFPALVKYIHDYGVETHIYKTLYGDDMVEARYTVENPVYITVKYIPLNEESTVIYIPELSREYSLVKLSGRGGKIHIQYIERYIQNTEERMRYYYRKYITRRFRKIIELFDR